MTRSKILSLLATSLALMVALSVPQSASAKPSAAQYNRVCVKIQRITGHTVCHARRSVTWKRLDYRKAQLNAAKQSCWTSSSLHRATVYTDSTGYHGDDLAANPDNFAELSTNPFGSLDFAALGGLPYRAVRYFHYRRWDARSVKLDLGAGGPRYPDVDLYNREGGTAQDLHFSDGRVRMTRKPCLGVFR